MKKAFTLIELLVVVLIIGILAATALPQYNKAVEKSRASNAFILGRAVKDAAERYYLVNDAYPDDMSELDITFICPSFFDCAWRDQGESKFIMKNKSKKYEILFSFDHRTGIYAGKHYCAAQKINPEANQICRTFAVKDEAASNDSWNRYVFN